MKTLKFSFGGNLCMETQDGLELEVEIGPRQYRALYEIDWYGDVTKLRFERNDARDGKPDYWVPDACLPMELRDEVRQQIEQEFQDEQRRIAEMADA
jgi:hypothetical protein